MTPSSRFALSMSAGVVVAAVEHRRHDALVQIVLVLRQPLALVEDDAHGGEEQGVGGELDEPGLRIDVGEQIGRGLRPRRMGSPASTANQRCASSDCSSRGSGLQRRRAERGARGLVGGEAVGTARQQQRDCPPRSMPDRRRPAPSRSCWRGCHLPRADRLADRHFVHAVEHEERRAVREVRAKQARVEAIGTFLVHPAADGVFKIGHRQARTGLRRQELPELAQPEQHGQPAFEAVVQRFGKAVRRRHVQRGHGAFRHQPRHPAAERGLARAGRAGHVQRLVRQPAEHQRVAFTRRGRPCRRRPGRSGRRPVRILAACTRRLRHVDRAQRRRPALLQLEAEQVHAAVLLLHPLAVGDRDVRWLASLATSFRPCGASACSP